MKWIGSPNYDTNRKPIDRVVSTDVSTSLGVSNYLSTKPGFMDFIVLRNRNKLKVLWSIIQLVVIDVMNFFNLGINRSTNFLFHNQYMNKLFGFIVSCISPGINVVSTLVSSLVVTAKTYFRFIPRKFTATFIAESTTLPIWVIRTIIASSVHTRYYTITRNIMLSI